MTNKTGVAMGRPGATGESVGLAWFGVGNAAARLVAFMTWPEGRPRPPCYRGVSRRRDIRGGPDFSLFFQG
ncbi:hypothetical protein Taro_019401 [Colocasia esculenta]|uniref:Uncharacterized protein n=1 Tax=Colocasia esculenta TaxID=4460 RepID=A0A843UL05_COLES|nr:hypothetical protein [Colocasia esculenta]